MTKIAIVFSAACFAVTGAGAELCSISRSEGQKMLELEFMDCPFAKGAFENDESLLLPIGWRMHDGKTYTFFSAADQKYNDGISWEMREVADGKLTSPGHKWTEDGDVWFMPSQMFEVRRECGKRGLYYHHDKFRVVRQNEGGERIVLKESTWLELGAETNGAPHKTAISGGVRELFRIGGAVSVRNVAPHRYCGEKAWPINEKTDSENRLSECDKIQWNLTRTQKEELKKLHLRHLENLHLYAAATNFYVIAGDGNFDGICDAYVSSDAERGDREAFDWTLYLSSEEGFRRAESGTSKMFDGIENLCIDAKVTARRDAFFRWDRCRRPSYIMPVTADGGRFELWSYAKHESGVKKLRGCAGLENAAFADCAVHAGGGVANLEDLFDDFAPLVRAERINCEVVPADAFGKTQTRTVTVK